MGVRVCTSPVSGSIRRHEDALWGMPQIRSVDRKIYTYDIACVYIGIHMSCLGSRTSPVRG